MKVDLTIIISVTVTIFGWIVGHYITTNRDRKIKRRDVSIDYLIKATRILADEIANRELTTERKIKLESIIIDIQLFGSSEQVKLANEFINDITSADYRCYDPLINNLRDDLRKQIGLDQITGNLRWLRFKIREN